MKLEQISSWNTYEAIEHELTNAEIKSWLLEQGPITKRIKSIAEFRLELIQDELSDATEDEILFLKIDSKEIRIREVILYGNENPMVFRFNSRQQKLRSTTRLSSDVCRASDAVTGV